MVTAFSLHAHEASASGDSGTPADVMARTAADRGLDLVGFVGHDARPSVPDDLAVETMTGTEHEVRTDPRRLHIVSFPDQGLDILAHPQVTFPSDTVAGVERVVAEHGVDAVEAYSRGVEHLRSEDVVSVPRTASDDAHNTRQVGVSYMTADVPPTPDAVARTVKRGDVTLHNPGYGGVRGAGRIRGRLHQGLNLLGSGRL